MAIPDDLMESPATQAGVSAAGVAQAGAQEVHAADPFLRAENEDDDGYDPYSDRRPSPEPLFERDPWA